MIDNDEGDQFTEALANTCRTAALPWDLSVLIASLRSVRTHLLTEQKQDLRRR
jgi:hypothetical protein